MQDYVSQLADPDATSLRESTCDVLAEALCATGAVLWAFGLAEQPRRSVAAAIQMGGETARGSVSLLQIFWVRLHWIDAKIEFPCTFRERGADSCIVRA